MPRWQDAGFSCGHVKAEMLVGYPGRDVEQALGHIGLKGLSYDAKLGLCSTWIQSPPVAKERGRWLRECSWNKPQVCQHSQMLESGGRNPGACVPK